MTYYHATDVKFIDSILKDGLHAGFDGAVYMCSSPGDALKFLALRFITKVAVLRIDIPDEYIDNVYESFDHNPTFFKCRAWLYMGDIPVDWIAEHSQYSLKKEATV